ncbi:prolipoprotein diacylglyceryl transferase [Synergistales bacterium]|nr:prolipoprotein diacylglyceryl transferase [Synergistales bacterium]
MYPTLFEIGSVSADSYYIIWTIAICAMVFWTRKRASVKYGVPYDDAADALFWVMCGVFAGATLGGYFDNWQRFADDPIRILYFWESGVSSGPGFIGGGLAGLWKLKKLGVSVNSFAESASIPCAFMLFVGRWGCFLNGCCRGLPTDSFYGISFPDNPSVRVFPSQLSESFAAFIIFVSLLIIEKKLRRSPEDAAKAAFLWPLFLISYGLYRFVFDFFRAGDRILGLRVGQHTGLLAVLVGAVWLVYSFKKMRAVCEDARPVS